MIKLTSKALENKIQNIVKKALSQQNRLYKTPLTPIIRNIKADILFDPSIDNGLFDHVFTGKLLKNTRSELQSGFDGSAKVRFGYFVEHGNNLEFGSEPHDPTYAKMLQWARKKGFDNPERAAALIRNNIINFGSQQYPIIQRNWDALKEDYKQTVFKRFRELFN